MTPTRPPTHTHHPTPPRTPTAPPPKAAAHLQGVQVRHAVGSMQRQLGALAQRDEAHAGAEV